jgi:hypothetical protein
MPTMSAFPVAARALSQCGRTADWIFRAGLKETIMSKATMRNSKADVRELRDDELVHVSGGRTSPNGRTDVIKAMGNTKWDDVELKR